MVRAYPNTTTSFVAQAISGRWFIVFATILVMAVSEPRYLFASYSGLIKSSLGYSQTTMNLISFFKDSGSTFGGPAGLLMEVAPPWVVLAAGGGLNFFGYFMIWLAVTHKIDKPAVWQMCFYIALSSNFAAFASTATVVSCIINFPEARGITLGMLKGFTSLSSVVIAQLYPVVAGQNPKVLLLFLAILPTVVSLAFVRTIRIIKTPKNIVSNTKLDDFKPFHQLVYMSFALAAFLFSMIMLQMRHHFSQRAYLGNAFGILLFLCLPLWSVFRQELKIWKLARREYQTSDINNVSQLSNHVNTVTEMVDPPTRKVDKWYQNVFRPPKVGEDHTILQAIFRVNMMILLVGTICGLGGTWTAIDNMGQIGASYGYSQRNVATIVSLFSIWNYLGRVISGCMSEFFVRKCKLPRALTITILQLLACIGHLIIAFGVPNGLYVASVIIGFCYGAFWPVLLAVISDIFGLKHYSTLFNIGPMAAPIGVYLLNVKVVRNLYDIEAKRQLKELGRVWKYEEELKCDGVSCFRAAFLIITAATAMAALLSLVNVVQGREFYQGDIYKRFRKVEKAVKIVGKNDRHVVVEVEKESR